MGWSGYGGSSEEGFVERIPLCSGDTVLSEALCKRNCEEDLLVHVVEGFLIVVCGSDICVERCTLLVIYFVVVSTMNKVIACVPERGRECPESFNKEGGEVWAKADSTFSTVVTVENGPRKSDTSSEEVRPTYKRLFLKGLMKDAAKCVGGEK